MGPVPRATAAYFEEEISEDKDDAEASGSGTSRQEDREASTTVESDMQPLPLEEMLKIVKNARRSAGKQRAADQVISAYTFGENIGFS